MKPLSAFQQRLIGEYTSHSLYFITSTFIQQVLEASRNREELENTLTDAPSLNFEAQGMTPRPQLQNQLDFDQDKVTNLFNIQRQQEL